MKITAIIVDDERLARKELRHLLGQLDLPFTLDIVSDAANADDAIELIEDNPIDLVFLDIQMPGKTGFDLLEELTTCPSIIFTTAYDEYAIKAFAANALDYLLKPVDPLRLKQALLKVSEVHSEQRSNTTGDADKMTAKDKVFIKDGEKCWFVPVEDVIAFASIGNYCRVILPDSQPMIRKTMGQLEERLPTEQFFRANRQHIVNLKKIENVGVAASGNLEVTLNNRLTVEMSRRQSQLFKEQMSF